jgi:O-antigen/teichoic acid export membrane protein
MAIKKQLIKYTIILSIGTVLSRFFILLFRMIAARELPLEEYGMLALIISIYASIIIFSHFDISPTLSHFFSKYRVKKKRELLLLYYNAILCLMPTTIIALLIFLFVLSHYGILSLGIGVASAIMFFSYSLYQHNTGVLKGFKRFEDTSLITIIMGLSRFLIIFIFFYLLGIRTFYAAFYAFVISLIMPFLLSFRWSIRDIQSIPLQISRKIIRRIYSFSFFIVLSDLARMGILLIPRLILSLENMSSVALFDMALVLYGMFNLVLMNIPATLVPLVTEKYSKTKKIPKIPLLQFSLISLLFLVSIYALFYFKADVLFVKIILGEKFLPSLSVFHIIFVSLPFFTYSSLIKGILQGVAKVKELALINIFSLAMALPLFGILRGYDLLGLATAFVIVVVIQAMMSYIILRNIQEVDFKS